MMVRKRVTKSDRMMVAARMRGEVAMLRKDAAQHRLDAEDKPDCDKVYSKWASEKDTWANRIERVADELAGVHGDDEI